MFLSIISLKIHYFRKEMHSARGTESLNFYIVSHDSIPVLAMCYAETNRSPNCLFK